MVFFGQTIDVFYLFTLRYNYYKINTEINRQMCLSSVNVLNICAKDTFREFLFYWFFREHNTMQINFIANTNYLGDTLIELKVHVVYVEQWLNNEGKSSNSLHIRARKCSVNVCLFYNHVL